MPTTLLRNCAAALLILGTSLAEAGTPATTGATPTDANRIVGTWAATVRKGPCGGELGPPFLATTVFHAGGTLSETNAAPLGGIPSPWGLSVRGPAFGTWSYDPRSGTYTASMRFNWYVNGLYHGYQQIDWANLVLSLGDSVMSGAFTAERRFVNGTPPVPNCGTVSQVRFP
jgi:hypothetical protein